MISYQKKDYNCMTSEIHDYSTAVLIKISEMVRNHENITIHFTLYVEFAAF
jgi:hypothetical protein